MIPISVGESVAGVMRSYVISSIASAVVVVEIMGSKGEEGGANALV